jgi:site-specific DNA-adenine methylase
MVAYLGGKARIGKKIWTAIRKIEDEWLNHSVHGVPGATTKLPYLEPFLGMGGVMIHFAKDNDGRELYGCDIMEDFMSFRQP